MTEFYFAFDPFFLLIFKTFDNLLVFVFFRLKKNVEKHTDETPRQLSKSKQLRNVCNSSLFHIHLWKDKKLLLQVKEVYKRGDGAYCWLYDCFDGPLPPLNGRFMAKVDQYNQYNLFCWS